MTPSLSGAIHRDSNTRASGPYAFQVPYVSIRIHSARYVFLASTKPRGGPDTPPERLGPVGRGSERGMTVILEGTPQVVQKNHIVSGSYAWMLGGSWPAHRRGMRSFGWLWLS